MAVFRKRSEKSAQKGERVPVRFDSSDEAVLDQQIGYWTAHERPRLGEVLLDLGVVDPGDLEESLQEQSRGAAEAAAAEEAGEGVPQGGGDNLPVHVPRLGEVLIERGHLDEIALAAALSKQFRVPMADLRLESPTQEALEMVPEALARELRILPLRVEEDRLQVVSADPFDVESIRAVTHQVGKVALRIGAPSEIERHLDSSYNVLRSADEHIRAFELSYEEVAPEDSDEVHLSVDENAPIVQVVSRIIMQAVRQRASDIHVEPLEESVRVRYRIDGAMTAAIELPVRMGPALSSRIKVMAELNIVERRRPQDGQFGVQVDGRPIDIRCSVVPTVHGEKVVLRLLDKTRSLISLNDLGMSPEVADRYRQITSSPLGMMLCTGPTGSGKTTTLYATLNEVNDATKNVVTIEDPVEYQFDGVTQMPVSGTGMSFADGLRGILRQDPDTILVGEIRDQETARIAMQAALTGHFVLSSLHAVDAVAAIHRFTDMGIEPFLVASAISGVVGQRLLRRICGGCADTYKPTSSEAAMLAKNSNLTPVWMKGVGCNLCAGTGYRGRVGVYELLEFSDAIRDMVVSHATHHDMRRVAMEEGMRTMQQQAFDLVAKGHTTVEDVVRSVYAPGMDDETKPIGELPAGKGELDPMDSELEMGHNGATHDETGAVWSTAEAADVPDSPRVWAVTGESER